MYIRLIYLCTHDTNVQPMGYGVAADAQQEYTHIKKWYIDGN